MTGEGDLRRAIAQLPPEIQTVITMRAVTTDLDVENGEFEKRIPEFMRSALDWWRKSTEGMTPEKKLIMARELVQKWKSDPKSMYGRIIRENGLVTEVKLMPSSGQCSE